MKSLAGYLLLVTLILSLCLTSGLYGPNKVNAAYSDPETVERERQNSGGMIRYKYYIEVNTIPNTWLFIGTYLMSLKGVNPENYKLAMESRSKNHQENYFYKSELSEGTWKDINGKSGLEILRKQYTDVLPEEINDLWISAVIGDDGVARDPMTGDALNSVANPYNLMELEELSPLNEKYEEIVSNLERNPVEEQHTFLTRMALIQPEGEFTKEFSSMGQNDVTRRADKLIGLLQEKWTKAYLEQEDKDRSNIIRNLIAQQAALRKSEIFRFLAVNDRESRLQVLSSMIIDGRQYHGQDEFEPIPEYMDAITKSSWNCKNSYQSAMEEILKKGNGVIGEEKYDTSVAFLEHVEKNESVDEEGKGLVSRLLWIDGIDTDNIRDAEEELKVCEELLSDSRMIYHDIILNSSQRYDDEPSQMSEMELFLSQKKITMDNACAEHQKLIKARVERMEQRDGNNEGALEFIRAELGMALLSQKNAYRGGVFTDYALGSIAAHIEWLRAYFDQLSGNNSDVVNAMDEEAELQKAYERAVAEGDYAEARRLELKIQAYDGLDYMKKDGKIREETDINLDGLNENADQASLKAILNGCADKAGERGDEACRKDVFDYLKYLEKLGVGDDTGDGTDGTGTDDGTGDGTDGTGTGDGTGDGTGTDGSSTGDGTGDGTGTDGTGTGDGSGTGAGGDGSGSGAGAGGDGSGSGTGAGGDGSGSGAGGDGSESGAGADGDGTGSGAGTDGSGTGGKDGQGTSSIKNNGHGKNYVPPDTSSHKQTHLTDDQLDQLLAGLFDGASFEDLSPDDAAAMVAALNQFGSDHSDSTVLDYSRMLLSKLIGMRSPFIYKQYTGETEYDYVSFGAVDRCRIYSGFRYVRENGMEILGELRGSGRISYSFRVGEKKFVASDGDRLDLRESVKFQPDSYLNYDASGFPYINESDAKRYLDVRAEYIKDTDYAVLVTGPMEATISRIVNGLEEAAG